MLNKNFNKVGTNLLIVILIGFVILFSSEKSIEIGYKLVTVIAAIFVIAFLKSDEFKGKK